MKNPLTLARPLLQAVALLALLTASLASGGCGRKIVAKVNGDPIYRDEFIDRTLNFRQATPGDGAGLQTLASMVNDMIVMQEARRENVAPTDAEVDARLQMIAQQLAPRGQTLEQFLQASGVTMEAAREEMRSELARRNLVTKGLQVTDAEIRKFYEEHKKEFTTPEQVTIRQITVATQKEAQDARKDLKGADFGLVALSRSTDIFKQQGGLVPPFTANPPPGFPVDPAVQKLAFKMKVGEISDPIKVGNQWVIIKLDQKEPAKTPTFEEMKEPIREGLLQRKAQESGRFDQVQQRLIALRQQAQIEVFDEQFKHAPQFQKQPTPTPLGGPEGLAVPGGVPPAGTPPPAGGQ